MPACTVQYVVYVFVFVCPFATRIFQVFMFAHVLYLKCVCVSVCSAYLKIFSVGPCYSHTVVGSS